MFAQILGETTCGIDGVQILVEVDVSNGLPSFDLVGLPAMAVRESKERVKAALRNSDYPFPMTRITVNLAPADLRKEGSGLDLPIAIGLMTCGRILEPEKLENKVFIGELSLDGRIRKVSGVLSMIMDAKKCGAQEVYIPQANAAEGKLIHGIDVYTVATLKELVEHLQGKNTLTPLPKENILQNNNKIYHVDFADVKGQLVARRRSQYPDGGFSGLWQDNAGAPLSDDSAADDGGRGTGGHQDLQHCGTFAAGRQRHAGASVPQSASQHQRQRASGRRQYTAPGGGYFGT